MQDFTALRDIIKKIFFRKNRMSKIVQILPENLPSFFKEQLKKSNTVFVFQTDVVKNSWADWCVSHPAESGIEAVELDRFTAWDKFKGENVSSKENDKNPIPAILRSFFVSSLISENAECTENNTIFKKIINPVYRSESDSFADWIVSLLPSLKLWHKTVTSPDNINYKLDEEDSDFLELYNRYNAFLEKHNLFEPSWIEPDFKKTGKEYIIFYPELLKDYSDYTDIFDLCDEITLVNLPDAENSPEEKKECLKYPDSRKELRRTILQIRKIIENGTRPDEISLNVPDLETYRPYLERELTKYEVPFVIKAGYPLIQNTAGKIFKEIQDCFTSNYSYDSIRSLILDEYIPWKTNFKEARENLIEAGNKLRCICGFNENINGKQTFFDSWETALRQTSSTNNRELELYKDLKHEINAICRSKSFSDIQIAWSGFKKTYLNEDDFSKEADAILGRCITELNALSEIEKTYCNSGSNLYISNHYNFFINQISKKTYTPQNKTLGISVYPYKTSAGAFFKHQFILDASQKNLEIQYKKLNFLSEEKRKALNLSEKDKKFNASAAFTRLYHSFNAENLIDDKKIIHFSYAEESFQGFSICHNALNEIKAQNDELDKTDFILNERNYMLGKEYNRPLQLTHAQKAQFEAFHSVMKDADETSKSENSKESSAIIKKINEYLIENRKSKNENMSSNGKIVITQTDMKNFFPCPRKWIFSKVLNLKEDSLDASLMGSFDNGNINHKILEFFMKDFLNSGKPLPVCNPETGKFSDEEEKVLNEKIKEYANKAVNDKSEDYAKSPLTLKMLTSQIDKLSDNIMDFLRAFLKPNICSAQKITTKSKTLGYGGCFVKGVEKSYSVQNENKNYNYYGKIDLLLTASLENSDANGWTIIDYKNTSSSMPAAKDIKAKNEVLGDFQMPMYITILLQNEKIQDVDAARFYSISQKESRCAVDHYTEGCKLENFKETLDTFEKYASEFEKTVTSGNFEPDFSKVDVWGDCIKCNFNPVCRKTYEVFKRK